ncbi:HAMP domain-containing histidine kinase [Blautia schinkii]|nr:HAMP domain-containing histidine kinase [Blautia schinkii]
MTGIVICMVCMGAIVLFCYCWFRRMYVKLTEEICDTLDEMIAGKKLETNQDLEKLSSKIASKIQKLGEVTQYTGAQNLSQKQEVQQMVSDISHQLKTPIANILMYADTLAESERLGEEEQRFVGVMRGQVEKLEFLVQALVKMSRLESNMLVLKKENAFLFDTLSKAVSAILPAADEKDIDLKVECPQKLRLFHDPKWTEEAIFNVLDNAVKYTPKGGKIDLTVESLQMYTRLLITDTGIGIQACNQNDIFKRFYREEKVHRESGVGIGLYLTREILARQGGYITVQSELEKGSTFSLYLSNERPA